MRTLTILTTCALLAGCTDSSIDQDSAIDGSTDVLADGPWRDLYGDLYLAPDGFELGKTRVFAHTEKTLYQVDPDNLAVTAIAPFGWPPATAITKMTDIALDKHGRMIGVSQTTVYAVDPATAACTRLATFPSSAYHFVGLSYVIDTTAIDKAEYLMGLDKDGAVYEIDPATGAAQQRGQLGGGLKAGGDVVSVKDFGTVATVTPPDSDTDWLATINPGTGAATLIGDTGVSKVFGLGYWKGEVYGFSDGGEFVLIDVDTGEATLQATNSASWWGAGVTTSAPVIE